MTAVFAVYVVGAVCTFLATLARLPSRLHESWEREQPGRPISVEVVALSVSLAAAFAAIWPVLLVVAGGIKLARRAGR